MLSISPGALGSALPADVLALLLAAAELLRRAQWNVLRLEWQQHHNAWEWQAVKAVRLALPESVRGNFAQAAADAAAAAFNSSCGFLVLQVAAAAPMMTDTEDGLQDGGGGVGARPVGGCEGNRGPVPGSRRRASGILSLSHTLAAANCPASTPGTLEDGWGVARDSDLTPL